MLVFSEQIADEYASLWDETKNIGSIDTPRKRTDKVWVRCLNGLDHSFEARMDRLPKADKNSECTVCSGKRLYPELNSLGVLHPKLISRYSSKNERPPTEVSASLSKNYWWYCEEHDCHYKFSVRAMLAENRLGCEACEKCRISIGKNYPELLDEWDYNKNSLSPFEVSAHNVAYVWWKCSLGHSYKTQANDKTSRGASCSVCSGYRVLPGFNDLVTKASPAVVAEYDTTKNDLFPEEIYWRTESSVWWKCFKGHSWKTRVNHRTVTGTGCPKCSAKVSKAEQELFDTLAKHFTDLEQGRRDILVRNLEVDMYSKKYGFGVEYCGVYWHNQIKFPHVHEVDHEKQIVSQNIGLPVYIVWEDDYMSNRNAAVSELIKCIDNRHVSERFTLRCTDEQCSGGRR